jgi:hypothetical protein
LLEVAEEVLDVKVLLEQIDMAAEVAEVELTLNLGLIQQY